MGAAEGVIVFVVLCTTTTLVNPVRAKQMDSSSELYKSSAFTFDMFDAATIIVNANDIPAAVFAIKFGTKSK